ncbi:peroxide stress protein YaaA [Roseobacteraceae bacterium S113]
MLIAISPAKRLDWSPVDIAVTQPDLQDDAVRLARTARNLTLRDLKSLMGLSDDLARLNRDRFRAFEEAPEPDVTRPAALAFAGDTYQGLRAQDFSAEDFAWSQQHLRILSGLYGVLRPLDAIQPYRLEMGSRLKTRRGQNLYTYWRDMLSKALNAQADAVGTNVLLNCASQEYFGAVDIKALKLRVITPVFLDEKNGEEKVISFFAKRARGSMARFVIQNRLTNPDLLRDFNIDGYEFDAARSEPDAPVFRRAERG